MNKKAIVLLNMGGARNKTELKIFLTNMFNDENILTIKSCFLRKIIAYFITTSRLNSSWKNYEKIGGKSPINTLTEKLVEKLNNEITEYKTYQVMRYTPPYSFDVIKQMKNDGIKEVILLPLYPQYSTTTTKSSLEDFYKYAGNHFKIKEITHFYKNKAFNKCIINELSNKVDNHNEYNLIFSAHGIPQKMVDDLGDPYENHLKEHISILSDELKKKNINFKSINLAFQSKVGPLKWLEPSLDDVLKKLKNEKVIIYPIAFIIDNFETDFELNIEYREICQKLNINDLKVCKCVNYNDDFINAIKDIIQNEI